MYWLEAKQRQTTNLIENDTDHKNLFEVIQLVNEIAFSLSQNDSKKNKQADQRNNDPTRKRINCFLALIKI